MDSLDSDVVFYLTSNGLIVVLEGVNEALETCLRVKNLLFNNVVFSLQI